MIKQQQKLTTFQLAVILIHAQIGVDMITFVNDAHKDAKYDSWISVIIAGITVQLIILMFGLLLKRFPNHNLFQIVEIAFGKVFGKIIIALYCIFLSFNGAMLISKFTLILKTWMMPLTPKWILSLLITFLGVYAAKQSIHVITRFFILGTFVIFVFLSFILYAFKDAHYMFILPIGDAGFVPILKGAIATSYSFQGFEYFLFIIPLVAASNKQIIKTASITNVLITLFYTFVVLICNLYFSTEEMILITEPIFYLVKSFSFNIIERPDLIFTSLWIVLAVTSVVILFYIASLGFNALFHVNKRVMFVYIVAGVAFFISCFLYGENRLDEIVVYFRPFVYIFSIIIPLLALGISFLFKRTGEKQE